MPQNRKWEDDLTKIGMLKTAPEIFCIFPDKIRQGGIVCGHDSV
jgi:hypothetical protein